MEMYRGIAGNRGITVSDEDAFLYALEQIQNADDQLKRDVVEMYFSGDFLYEREDVEV